MRFVLLSSSPLPPPPGRRRGRRRGGRGVPCAPAAGHLGPDEPLEALDHGEDAGAVAVGAALAAAHDADLDSARLGGAAAAVPHPTE